MKKGLIIVLLAIMALVFSQSAFALTKQFNITVTVSTLNMDLRNHDDTDGYPGWDIIVGPANAITMLENDLVKVIADSGGSPVNISTRILNQAGWAATDMLPTGPDQFVLLAEGFDAKPTSPDPQTPIAMGNPRPITPGTMEPLVNVADGDAWLCYAFYAPNPDNTNNTQTIEIEVDVSPMP